MSTPRYNNICIYFDAPPSTYCLPGLWALTSFAAGMFQFWKGLTYTQALNQGKLSHKNYKLLWRVLIGNYLGMIFNLTRSISTYFFSATQRMISDTNLIVRTAYAIVRGEDPARDSETMCRTRSCVVKDTSKLSTMMSPNRYPSVLDDFRRLASSG